MRKTILVIGSVTAEQYQAARLEFIRKGVKPEIVRTTINDLFSCEEVLLGNIVAEFDMYGDVSEEHDCLIRQNWLRHYEQFGDIIGIVITDDELEEVKSDDHYYRPWYVDIDVFGTTPTWRLYEDGDVQFYP